MYTPAVSMVITALLSIFYSNVGIANALDLKGAKESPCFKINKTADIGSQWLENTQKTFYYPLMSRLDLYYTSLAVSGKGPKDLQENEVYYDSCLHFEEISTIGFGGKRVTPNVTSFYNDTIKHCEFKTDSAGWFGTVYPTFTDNSTFMFMATCMNDEQMSWGVISSQKRLPEETVKKIHDHAESLGFKREFFTGLRYDDCNDL